MSTRRRRRPARARRRPAMPTPRPVLQLLQYVERSNADAAEELATITSWAGTTVSVQLPPTGLAAGRMPSLTPGDVRRFPVVGGETRDAVTLDRTPDPWDVEVESAYVVDLVPADRD